MLPLTEAEADGLALGDPDALAMDRVARDEDETAGEGEVVTLGDCEELAEGDDDTDTVGLTDADGDSDGCKLAEACAESDTEPEDDSEADADRDASSDELVLMLGDALKDAMLAVAAPD